MTHGQTILLMLTVLYVLMVGSSAHVEAQATRQMSPQAAQQYASDSEKATSGDPDAAYRLGQALESGRLGGLKDLHKALTFYRQAAAKGHQQASARAAEIEAELGESQKSRPTPPPSQGK